MKSANGEPRDQDPRDQDPRDQHPKDQHLKDQHLRDQQGAPVECTDLLAAYLQAEEESQSEGLVARLITDYASPTIRSMVRVKLGFRGNRSIAGYTAQEAEELCSEAVLNVLRWLRKLKSNDEAQEVRNFQGLVAVIAYRVCSEYMRQVDPDRASLVKKIRYHLTSNPAFEVWQNDDKEWICGFAKWRSDAETGSAAGSIEVAGSIGRDRAASNNNAERGDAFGSFRQELSPQAEAGIKGVPDLLTAVFDWARAPMLLHELMDIAVRWWRTKEGRATAGPEPGFESRPLECVADPGTDIAGRLEGRQHLRLAWDEIMKLPERQRAALLLNLRDPGGDGAIALFPFLGIVSFEEIARALSMSPDDLIDIWDSLPLSDMDIAARLGATRQNVVNLRRSARERLQRRLRGLGAGS